jgi:hypothetical protein
MAKIQDVPAALEMLDRWISLTDERWLARFDGDRANDIDDWFVGHVTLVQQIAAAACGDSSARSINKWGGSYSNEDPPWIGTREEVIRVRGAIATRSQAAQIFTAPGPRLSAASLHPWVWNAARDLWADGHHRSAVGNAATAVETMLRERTGRFDVSGAPLVGQVFSIDPPTEGKPRLRLTNDVDDPGDQRWKSMHVGAMHFGQGCFEGIRNWAAHTLDDSEEQVALEYLAALSVFARWIDQSRLISPADHY